MNFIICIIFTTDTICLKIQGAFKINRLGYELDRYYPQISQLLVVLSMIDDCGRWLCFSKFKSYYVASSLITYICVITSRQAASPSINRSQMYPAC